ncbi:calmodulin-A-like [Bolinopsis microptera]|uniref:calmodulin-A-like n=1 Tax=Bolinopsis microptera TaxID=2820187 RepID=UPI00307A8D13
MSKSLSDTQLADFKETFTLFDKNGDGTITTDELEVVMRSLGQDPTEEYLQATIAKVDANGNGSMEFDEFLELMTEYMEVDESEENMRETFDAFDLNQDGRITGKELKTAMKNLGNDLTDEDITKMIKEADLDNDGCVDYDEFVRMMSD